MLTGLVLPWPDPDSRPDQAGTTPPETRRCARARARTAKAHVHISQPTANARAAASAVNIRTRNQTPKYCRVCSRLGGRRACPAQRPARTPAQFRAWAKALCPGAHSRAESALTHHRAACRAGAEQPRCWAHNSATAVHSWARTQRLPGGRGYRGHSDQPEMKQQNGACGGVKGGGGVNKLLLRALPAACHPRRGVGRIRARPRAAPAQPRRQHGPQANP